MGKLRASDLSGYETVADLLPKGHFLSFTCLWALRIEHRVTPAYELERCLILDLGETFELDDRPLVRIVMSQPEQCSIPDTLNIIGLAIEDIRSLGYARLRFRVYDYEMSDFDVLCASGALARANKPQYE